MKFPGKSKIQVAAPQRSHFDLSQTYIGTMDFGKLVPCNYRLTYPNEHYSFKPQSFLRCDPLVVPTFGNIRMIMDTFFVPYHLVFASFEKLLTRESTTDENGTSYKVESLPYIEPDTLLSVLFGTEAGSWQSDFGKVETYDLYDPEEEEDYLGLGAFRRAVANHNLYTAADTPIKFDFLLSWYNDTTEDSIAIVTKVKVFTFNDLGRRIWNILLGLGYNINPSYEYDAGDVDDWSVYFPSDSSNLSAIPLLAYIKVYLDWYQSNQFTNDSALRKLFDKIVKHNYGTALSSNDLQDLLYNVFSRCYNQDLFTASWLTPNADSDVVGLDSPNSGNSYIIGGTVVGTGDGASSDMADDSNSALSVTLTQRLQNFIDRWRIGGKRDVDRNLAEFGMKSKDVNYHRSQLINSYSQELAISDVMANNENPEIGLQLGDYAGKGLSYGNSSFEFDSDDYGIILSIVSIVPQTGYVYGVNRELNDLTLFDLYTPEFDSVGVEAVRFGQLTQMDGVFATTLHPLVSTDSIFGYVPRYAHHKVGHDTLAGDFRFGSSKVGSDAWHLFRADYKDGLQNNEQFRQIRNVGGQLSQIDNNQSDDYDRIFNVSDANEDHFWLFAHFNIQAQRPMRTIAESLLPVYDGKEHNTVSVDYNGKQL